VSGRLGRWTDPHWLALPALPQITTPQARKALATTMNRLIHVGAFFFKPENVRKKHHKVVVVVVADAGWSMFFIQTWDSDRHATMALLSFAARVDSFLSWWLVTPPGAKRWPKPHESQQTDQYLVCWECLVVFTGVNVAASKEKARIWPVAQ
jgi:hypothetical protein